MVADLSIVLTQSQGLLETMIQSTYQKDKVLLPLKSKEIDSISENFANCFSLLDIVQFGSEFITVDAEESPWKCTVCSNAVSNCKLRFNMGKPNILWN